MASGLGIAAKSLKTEQIIPRKRSLRGGRLPPATCSLPLSWYDKGLFVVSEDTEMTMLDRMRRHRGWLKWSLALVVLTFIAFYIPSFLDDTGTTVGATPREVIADVD